MAKVTVCVPAYHLGGSFVHETLRSLQGQSFSEIAVEVAIDPPADNIIDLIKPFLSDSRFQMRINPSRLGWDGNIAAQLQRVATPFFAILPHDDILHRDYISTLLPLLEGRDSALVAYCDLERFGARTGPKWLDLPLDGPIEERLLAFFLAGATAQIWKGVARSTLIRRVGGFPVIGNGGLTAEWEWALALLLQGPALRVPRALYFKRVHPRDVQSASRTRVKGRTAAALASALQEHRTRMLRALAGMRTDTPAGQLLPLAADAAILAREGDFLAVLPGETLARAQSLRADLDKLSSIEPRAVIALSLIERTLARHSQKLAKQHAHRASGRKRRPDSVSLALE